MSVGYGVYIGKDRPVSGRGGRRTGLGPGGPGGGEAEASPASQSQGAAGTDPEAHATGSVSGVPPNRHGEPLAEGHTGRDSCWSEGGGNPGHAERSTRTQSLEAAGEPGHPEAGRQSDGIACKTLARDAMAAWGVDAYGLETHFAEHKG